MKCDNLFHTFSILIDALARCSLEPAKGLGCSFGRVNTACDLFSSDIDDLLLARRTVGKEIT